MRDARERAFTIVEVVVAAFVITLVVVGMISFIASSGRSQQRSSVRQQMVAHHDKVLQTVRSERRWLEACIQKKLGCNEVNGDGVGNAVDITQLTPLPAPPADGPKLLHRVRAQAVDSRADNDSTNADRDGLVPDFYRIEIEVWLDPSDLEEYGKVPAFDSVSTVDANALGRANGTLVVDVCEVVNQIDERIAISGCRADGGNPEVTPMRQQPECGNVVQKLSQANFEPKNEAWPVFPFGCNAAIKDASDFAPRFAGMWVRSAPNVDFYIEAENGKQYHRDFAVLRAGSSSTFVFGGIPSGPYKVVVSNPGTGREVWEERMVPDGTQVSVQANQEARALVVVRPTQGLGEYRVAFGRTTYHYKLEKEVTARPPAVTTVSLGSSTATVTTTYVYEWLIPSEENGGRPVRKEWWGPAWHGFVGMASKPFDRQRFKDVRVGHRILGVAWTGTNTKSDGTYWIKGLGTGLYSLPAEIPLGDDVKVKTKQFEYLGDIGDQRYRCPPSGPNGPSGGGCDKVGDERFAWMYSGSKANQDSGQLGKADSSVFYHSADGECYVRSFSVLPPDLWKWGTKRILQRGGARGQRCDLDLHLKNGDKVEDFFPTRIKGKGGKRYLIAVHVSMTCSGCPGGTSGGGSTSSGTAGGGDKVWGRGAAPSPPSDNPPPPMQIPKEDGSTASVNS